VTPEHLTSSGSYGSEPLSNRAVVTSTIPDLCRADRSASRASRRRFVPGSIEAHALQGEIHFLECLFAEIGDAQQIVARAMEQVLNGEYAALLEAIRGSHGQTDLGRAHFQPFLRLPGFLFGSAEWDAGA